MRTIKRSSRHLVALPLFTLLATCFSSGALASAPGSIVYSPAASSVPTLGGTALIVLALLMAVIAFRLMRKAHSAPLKLMVGLVATAAISSGIGGAGLISDAIATPANSVTLNDSSGGEEFLSCGLNDVANGTDVPMAAEVKTVGNSVTIDSDNCTGSVLSASGSDGDSCAVDLNCEV